MSRHPCGPLQIPPRAGLGPSVRIQRSEACLVPPVQHLPSRNKVQPSHDTCRAAQLPWSTTLPPSYASCSQAYLNMTHISLYHIQAILPNQLSHQLDAFLVGCHLGTKIRQVVMQVPGSTAARDLAWCPQGLCHSWTDRVTTEPTFHAPRIRSLCLPVPQPQQEHRVLGVPY